VFSEERCQVQRTQRCVDYNSCTS